MSAAMMTMNTLRIPRVDDFHLHLRDGDQLATLVPHAARQFRRAIIMPNLKPPIITTEDALAYRERIMVCETNYAVLVIDVVGCCFPRHTFLMTQISNH